MRADLHARVRERAHAIPGEVAGAADQAGDDEEAGAHAALPQRREDDPERVRLAVVEGEDDRLVRQRRAPLHPANGTPSRSASSRMAGTSAAGDAAKLTNAAPSRS